MTSTSDDHRTPLRMEACSDDLRGTSAGIAAAVAVRVVDDGPGGPGVPDEIGARLLDRGVRAGARCGAGTGLHPARPAGAAFVRALPVPTVRAAA